MPLSDAEVICTWMEPKPKFPDVFGDVRISAGGWWKWRSPRAGARWPGKTGPNESKVDSLDALHEVEARLTDEQWQKYAGLMMDPAGIKHTHFLLHATAEQKISALAAVLRPEMEKYA